MISIKKCDSYNDSLVLDTVRELIDDLGGISRFISPGQSVLIKPNMLTAIPPEAAVTTHPSVVRALILLAAEAGAKEIRVGDSPAVVSFAKAAEQCGISGVVSGTEAKLTPFSEVIDHPVTGGKVSISLPLAAPVLQADVVISAAKLKTHGLTSFTGAVKNLFGCLPGPNKAAYHLRMQDRRNFGELLVDIYQTVKPTLCIIDGIVGMEGEGPRNGKPKKLDVLMASPDGYALDAAACRFVGIPPKAVPYLTAAAERGLLNIDADFLAGTGVLPVQDFAQSSSRDLSSFVPKPIYRLGQRFLTATPHVHRLRCAGCGICKDACPPSAITISGGAAVIDRNKCIRCYCCQELCPRSAVELKENLLMRTLLKRRR